MQESPTCPQLVHGGVHPQWNCPTTCRARSGTETRLISLFSSSKLCGPPRVCSPHGTARLLPRLAGIEATDTRAVRAVPVQRGKHSRTSPSSWSHLKTYLLMMVHSEKWGRQVACLSCDCGSLKKKMPAYAATSRPEAPGRNMSVWLTSTDETLR